MPLATYQDACREYARNYGMDNPDQEWVLSPWDSWEKNPFYTGKPGRHPEDDSDLYDENKEEYVDRGETPF